MRVRYGYCNSIGCNEKGICPFMIRIIKCSNLNYQYSEAYKHAAEPIETEVIKRGITDGVKLLIEDLVFERGVVRPKKIEIKLKSSKLKELVDTMPTLLQIQSYIKYKRSQQGDNNSLDDVKTYVSGKKFKAYKEDDEMFFFGENLNDGSDNDHFQLGFTSLPLLNLLVKNGMFHVDATYKIIKYCYPLIVFGITDLNHKFFPIAFMITSHEKAVDYIHFFASLKKVANKGLGIVFSPSFMVTDASRAMFNAIKLQFPNCVVIMCWFHLKMNVSLFNITR